jgi:hypothetical protein
MLVRPRNNNELRTLLFRIEHDGDGYPPFTVETLWESQRASTNKRYWMTTTELICFALAPAGYA